MLDPALTTVKLLEEFLKYRSTKRAEELKSAEWQQLEKEYIMHLTWRFQYQKQAFTMRMVASVLLTLLVLGLIASGVVFAFLQLNFALQQGDVGSLQTELAVQTAGQVSIGSSVVGAVVLVISLLFFHLYLKHVFQIGYPVPPHISLSDTDARNMLQMLRSSNERKQPSSAESNADEELKGDLQAQEDGNT